MPKFRKGMDYLPINFTSAKSKKINLDDIIESTSSNCCEKTSKLVASHKLASCKEEEKSLIFKMLSEGGTNLLYCH